MNKIWKSFIKLIENLLNDDNGISEESYNHILDMIEENFGNIHPDDFNIWMSIYRQVKATDGRFYLKD